MPRKTRKSRKPGPVNASDTTRRQPTRHAASDQAKPQNGLQRHKRIDQRPPKFPGRLGGR